MKKTILYIIFAAVILTAVPCFADLTIEQECQGLTRVKTMMTSWKESTYDYKRRIFIKDGFLAVQLIVNDIPTREYGFDFKSKIYYESDLINKTHLKYLFSAIHEEFARRKTAELASPQRPAGRAKLSGSASFADLKVKSTKELFARKKIGELSCVLYRYQFGPGYSPFRPLSWGTDIRAWVTKDIPGYALYEKTADLLREECGFYLAKSNEISDFIIALMYSDGFPIEIRDVTKRDYGVGRLVEEGKATLVKLDTAPIPDGELSYFADADQFILNAAEPTAAEDQRRFGPAVGLSSRESGGVRYAGAGESRLFYYVAIPIVLFGGLIYFLARSARRRAALPGASEPTRLCPHCGAIIGKVYLVCPKCNKPVETKKKEGV